jgi:hypothetical protein
MLCSRWRGDVMYACALCPLRTSIITQGGRALYFSSPPVPCGPAPLALRAVGRAWQVASTAFYKGALLGYPLVGVRMGLVPSLCEFPDVRDVRRGSFFIRPSTRVVLSVCMYAYMFTCIHVSMYVDMCVCMYSLAPGRTYRAPPSRVPSPVPSKLH